MRREIQTGGGPIAVSGDPDGPVMLHTPARRPAVLTPDKARRLGQALLRAAAGSSFAGGADLDDGDEMGQATSSCE